MTLPDFLHQDTLGEILLAGHRVALQHVVSRYQQGYSPELIVGHYPTLPLALVHKVIAFYLENRADVDRYVASVHDEIERQAAQPQAGPSFEELKRRLAARRPAEST